MQRLLDSWEQANFLARHPMVAARVATTKTALLTGAYDFTAPQWGEIDVNLLYTIPPNGLAVDDGNNFGLVVIQPAPNGEIYFSGWVEHTTAAVVNEDVYQSPRRDPSEPECDWLCQLGSAASLIKWAAIGALSVWAYSSLKNSR